MTKREQQIDRAILRALKDAGDYLLPEDTLRDDVGLRTEPAPLESEFNDRLRGLDSRALIIGTRADYGTKWKLTAAGRVHCSENRI